jgi:hypothetical protein
LHWNKGFGLFSPEAFCLSPITLTSFSAAS